MKSVFLYFGSFNPPHIGHLSIAHYVVSQGLADELWFVISPHNPMKKEEELIDAADRVRMMELAVDSLGFDDRVKVCDVELGMAAPSYTYNTLVKLGELYPDVRFTIVMGEDNYVSLSKWYRSNDLVREYDIVVYPRNGFGFGKEVVNDRIKVLCDVPTFNISSSLIRDYIYKGIDISLFTRDAVVDYIKTSKLYDSSK